QPLLQPYPRRPRWSGALLQKFLHVWRDFQPVSTDRKRFQPLCYESSLGNAVADAVRISLNSDVAIICGGDLAYGLLPGTVTYDEIKNVFTKDSKIAMASLTVKEFRQVLERGLANITLNAFERIDEQLSTYDGFPQISGFKLYYDVSAPPGERVYKILINGENVDLDSETHTLTLGSTVDMLKGEYGHPPVNDIKASELTLSTVMMQYIVNGLSEYSPLERRMQVRGINDGVLSAYMPITIFPILTIVFLVAHFTKSRRETEMEIRKETPWYE
ncbi:MAG: hypothetical protein GX357_00185, partial [Firmicutes bacterium]|nr:hypothetical protein [Bacillota bacterium]